MTLRGLFEFRVDPARAIPLEEVEPAKRHRHAFRDGRDVARLDQHPRRIRRSRSR